LGIIELESAIVNIYQTIESMGNAITDAILVLQEELSGISKVVLQNQMALDVLLLAFQGGAYVLVNTTWCIYVAQSSRISTDIS
ncbi:ERVV2 protein, partial [Chauna torquata]|nr:ERVV2 protein [Chauna torquata]